MIKKRIIGSIIIKDEIVVQSFGFSKFLPLGSPKVFVENLDRWGADEIFFNVIDRSNNQLGPHFELIKIIGKSNLSTPIIYSGGIKSVEDAKKIIELGADRIAIDNLLFSNIHVVQDLINFLGAQAIIISLPVTLKKNILLHYNYIKKCAVPFSKDLINLLQDSQVSEVMLVDWQNDGGVNKFNKKIVNSFFDKKTPLILFGGINDHKQINNLFRNTNVSAVSIGNALSYSENAIQKLKKNIEFDLIRPPHFSRSIF